MYKVSKTYDVVTPESAEQGDFSESGFVYEEKSVDLTELLEEIKELGYYENYHPKQKHQSLYGEPDTDLYTGADTTYALHVRGSKEAMSALDAVLEKRAA